MTKSFQKGNQPDKPLSKLYVALGVVVAVLVAALILWNNGLFQKSETVTAATIGEQAFDNTEVSYYYYQVYNSTYNMAKMYEQYGMSYGYDTSLKPEEQFYDEEAGKTWADYFRETALNQLQQVVILTDQAGKDQYSLSEEGAASVDAQMKSIDAQLTQYSVTYGGRESYYFGQMYGENMTKGLLKDLITQATLANEYAQWRADQFTYDEAALTAYYKAHTEDLDSFDYRICFIPAKPETEVDEEGNQAAPTEEQTAAAMKLAKQAADEMASQVKRGKDFNLLATEYADETAREQYKDPSYNLTIDGLGSSLTAVYGDWLKDDARRAGQVGVIEQEGSGYYVVQFLGRERRDNSYQTVDASSILVKAETTESTDEQGNTVNKPTEEQLAAARTAAEDILTQWEAVSDQTSDAFLALAPAAAEGEEPAGEALTEVSRNTYGADFDKWAFTPGAATLGSSSIVEATDEMGTVIGYRIMYLTAFGQPRWEFGAESALRSADYQVWFEGVKEGYPITQAEGMKLVGPQA